MGLQTFLLHQGLNSHKAIVYEGLIYVPQDNFIPSFIASTKHYYRKYTTLSGPLLQMHMPVLKQQSKVQDFSGTCNLPPAVVSYYFSCPLLELLTRMKCTEVVSCAKDIILATISQKTGLLISVYLKEAEKHSLELWKGTQSIRFLRKLLSRRTMLYSSSPVHSVVAIRHCSS